MSDDCLGQSLAEIFSLALADLLLRARERAGGVSGEYTVRHLPESRTFNVSVSPVEELGFILVWQDISGLKEGERIRLASERAERQRVMDTFARYMSPTLIERVLADEDILARRERRDAIVLFADLRGFTRLTVEHSPDDVMALLNNVFAEMMEIVYRHEGVIFDIAGDELMIGFNVPYHQPDARQRALTTAIIMQEQFAAIKERWQSRDMHVGMSIGINQGLVVLGHVGGRARMNYAMVGQAVNIAHRLVEIADDGQIAVSPDLLTGGLPAEVNVRIRELPPQPIKGVDSPQPISIIELTS